MIFTNTLKADVWFVLVTLLAAISWIFSKEAVLIMPPLLFISLRFLLAGLLLAALGYKQIMGLNRAQFSQAIIVGSTFGLGMCFWIMGLYSGVSLSVGSFITSLSVVLVPVLDKLFFKAAAPRSVWIAMPVAAVGLAFLSLNEGLQVEKGHVLFLIATFFLALFFILNVRAANHRQAGGLDEILDISKKVPALSLTAITLLTVALLSGVLSLIMEQWSELVGNFSIQMVFWVCLSAFIGTALRFFIQTHAQSLSSHSHGVVIMVIEPICTAILATWWFAESLTDTELIGCGFIFVSLIINKWSAVLGFIRRPTVEQ